MKYNVYVSESLAERMKKAKGDVNWSEVAQRAFEQKLGELAQAKARKTMTDVIDRLRASKNKAMSANRVLGKEAGERWAKNDAEYDQLYRIAKFRESFGTDWGNINWASGSSGFAGSIVESALGESFGGAADYNDFWELVAGEEFDPQAEGRNAEEEFCYGFLEGVEEVFNEVESQL